MKKAVKVHEPNEEQVNRHLMRVASLRAAKTNKPWDDLVKAREAFAAGHGTTEGLKLAIKVYLYAVEHHND